MMKIYDLLYRQVGIRRLQNLLAPKLFDIQHFHFARGSILHYVSHDENNLFPEPDSFYFSDLNPSKRIFTQHVTQMDVVKGNARKLGVNPLSIIKPFHLQHKKFKFLNDVVLANKDLYALDVFNYGLLNHLYKPAPNPMSHYFQWWNIEKTVWNNIKEICKRSDRQHFIFYKTPDNIPPISMLRLFANKDKVSMLKLFNSPEKLAVLEFWKWVDPVTRASSTIGELTVDEMRKINLVFVHNNQWCILNISYIYNWIKDNNKEEAETPQAATKLSLKPIQIQKIFLRMLISVNSNNLITEEDMLDAEDPEFNNQENKVIQQETTDSDDDESGEESDIKEKLYLTNIAKTNESKDKIPLHMVDDNIDVKFNDTIDISSLFDNLDSDLEELETLAKKELQIKGLQVKNDEIIEHESLDKHVDHLLSREEIEKIVYDDLTDHELLLQNIELASDYGVMSASEYKNTKKLADSFLSMESPYDKEKTIEEFGVIKPEEVKLDVNSTKLKDTNFIIDKSMLESRLNLFDKQYIKHVMKKNITNAVSSIRRAGVLIQNYEIENESSKLGDFEIHTIKVKPIDGASSTLRFKLPVVNENGEFTVSCNKYRMRKQRVDKPVRKIDSLTVGLSSYYGKLFVSRSEKKVNDFGNWLVTQIFELGFSSDKTNISDIKMGNVFNAQLKAPKIYTILAQHFKSLNVSGYKLFLDREEVAEKFFEKVEAGVKGLSPLAQLELLEKQHGDGLRFIAISPKKEMVFVNSDNDFLVVDKDTKELKNIGDFCNIALISKLKAPVDFTVLKIFTKSIPVVVILGYLIGLDNIIKLLGMELNKDIRFVEGNKRVDLRDDEFSIVFNDRKMVISRKHQLGSMILAGYNEYWKTVKMYDYQEFNNKNVYFNLLDSVKISARYIKEIELLDQMFIDPITKDLLKEDHLPLTLKGLLVYSSQLLIDDLIPNSQGTERIRGYERFSGAVYKELVLAIKGFKARGIRGKSQIELNPYAVWKNITTDSANMLVADINPIENLKQVEYVTLAGEGGRNKDAIKKSDRVYQDSDMGTISEATVDSSDVAVNSYLSANPIFNSVYGTSEKYDFNKNGPASLISTSALISVGSDMDD